MIWKKKKSKVLVCMCIVIFDFKKYTCTKVIMKNLCIFPVNWTGLQKKREKISHDKNSTKKKQLSLLTAQWVELKRFAIN